MNSNLTLGPETIELIERAGLSFVATTNNDGSANLAPIASLSVRNGLLFFVNMASRTTIENLRRDPRVTIAVADIFQRRGVRLRGQATSHEPPSVAYSTGAEHIWSSHGRQYPIHEVVTITLQSVEPVLSPAYRYGGLSEGEIESVFLRRYGVERLEGTKA